MIEELINVPTIGIVPHMDLNIDEEDGPSARTNKLEDPEEKQKEYDKLAASLREYLDMEKIYSILNEGMQTPLM